MNQPLFSLKICRQCPHCTVQTQQEFEQNFREPPVKGIKWKIPRLKCEKHFFSNVQYNENYRIRPEADFRGWRGPSLSTLYEMGLDMKDCPYYLEHVYLTKGS